MIDMRLQARGLILVCIPLAIQIACVLSLYGAFIQTHSQALKAEQSKEFALSAVKLAIGVGGGVQVMLFYAFSKGLIGDEYFDEMMETIHKETMRLKTLAGTNVERQKAVERLASVESAERKVFEMMKAMDIEEVRNLDTVPAFKEEEFKQLAGIATAVSRVVNLCEREDNAARIELLKNRERLRYWMLAAMTITALAALLLGVFYGTNIAGRMQRLVEVTALISRRKHPLPPVLKGSDEIAQFDALLRRIDAAITEAEDKESALVREAADAILSLDDNLTVVFANPATQRLLGVEPSAVIGRPLKETVLFDHDSKVVDSLHETIASKGSTTFESTIKGSNNARIDVMWSASWSKVQNLLFCVVHDISERKEVDRLREEFIQTISADLRKPLVELGSGMEEVLRDYSLPEPAAKELQMAQRSIDHLSRLLDDLLDLESIRTGRLTLTKAPASVAEILERSLTNVSALAEQKGIAIKRCGNEKCELIADRDRIVQVVINLLSNAIKFSPANSIITVEVESDDNGIQFSVTDEGKGIPEQFLEVIFQPFERLASDAEMKSGAGLGLSICKLIVDGHGGKIGVLSSPGKGSKFWFTLPKIDCLL
ncbi:MAG TPA: ATP-binding protein [Candidatus Obscuribacterales bacterium]